MVMSKRKYHACPICGNNMQNGYCLRCGANESSRAKRWRSGDRGGMRPERRKCGAGAPPLNPPVERKSETSTIARCQKYSTSDFTLAIHGDWVNLLTNRSIKIDTVRGDWYFRNKMGRQRRQRWKPKKVSRDELHFMRRGKRIVARIAADGSLSLQDGNRKVPFAALKDGRWQRTCKDCFHKTAWQEACCPYCGKLFRSRRETGLP